MAMQDENFFNVNVHVVIKGLLAMLLELGKVGVILHEFRPYNAFASSLMTRLVATSLFGLTISGMRVMEMERRSMP
jgi:hypothetical protein